jgi:hypothetical protein
VLPGGGPAAVLPAGDATFTSGCGTSTNIPTNGQGRFKNNLLAQTITFALNLRLDPYLTTFPLPDPTTPWLRTEESDYVNGICGDGDDIGNSVFSNYYVPPSVTSYLGSGADLNDLLDLANTALGGGSIGSLSLSDIASALDAYNKGFDEGRFFAGYYAVPPPKVVADEPAPGSFELAQNHPNPFNPSTTISFTLPEASTVYLAVYNSLGEEVSVLVNDEVAAGIHSVVWNAANAGVNMPSGVYTYRIHAVTSGGREFHEVRKMMLVK